MDLVINYQNFYERRIMDLGTFKYVLRSLDTNADVFNKIYLIYGDDLEILPDWLDKNKFILVKHSDFINEKRLPTFNQCVVEENLCNISGLSEKFVYMRENTFFMKECNENDFFENDKAVISYSNEPEYEDLYKNENMYSKLMYYVCVEKASEKQAPIPEYKLIVPEKGAVPMFKTFNASALSHLKDILETLNDTFEKDGTSIPHDIFTIGEILNEQTIHGCERKLIMLNEHKANETKNILETYDGNIAYLENSKIDNENDFNEIVNMLHVFLETKFNNKSKYEL